MKNQRYAFQDIATTLNTSNRYTSLLQTCQKVEEVNKILFKELAYLNGTCKCGAIDNDNNTVILFCNNNSSFYKTNNLVSEIEQILRDNQFFFDNILVKLVQKQNKNFRKKQSQEMSEERYNAYKQMIEKLGLNYELNQQDIKDIVNNERDDDMITI